MGSSLFTRKLPLWIALLSGIATLLTFNYYQLFWGIQFVFGMSVALATLFLKRGPWGAIITIPVVISTYVLWGEPYIGCLLYTSPSPRDLSTSRMPSSA